jgi:hypothetical protein
VILLSSGTLWTYALPCLAALLIAGLVLSTTNAEPHGTHRAPRGYVPAADRATPLPLDPAPALVMRQMPMSDEEIGEFKTRFLAAQVNPLPPMVLPVEHIGATETTNREDYVAAPAPLDPDAPEVWLAKWQAEYNAERLPLDELAESDQLLIERTDQSLRTVQQVCEEIAARLTSVAEAAVFDWRITTDTGQLPIIDGPIADAYAAALLES